MQIQQFEEAIKKNGFVIGDSFWIDDSEFEVVGKRPRGVSPHEDETVFKWELAKEEFIQIVEDNHPEIENPEESYDKHADEVIHCFEKGLDVLVGECGATYGTVMNDAVDEVIK